MRRHSQTSNCLNQADPLVTKSQIVASLVWVTRSLFSISYQPNRCKADVTHSFKPSQLYKADYFPVFLFCFFLRGRFLRHLFICLFLPHGYVIFNLRTAAFKAYCAIWVRRSNFRHQVSPRESTKRRKVELWARNVREFCLKCRLPLYI
jgi:hypothetical protein